MSEKEFINGVSAKAPHERAPDFIKARVSIKLADFAQYLRDLKLNEPDVEWLNFDIKESKGGKWYVERDSWRPQEKVPQVAADPLNDDVPFS
jgi:hypothetical protein